MSLVDMKEMSRVAEIIEQNQLDAERYRWLRSRFEAEPIYSGLIQVGLSETFTIQGSRCGVFPSCVDAAIDAAMADAATAREGK